MKKFYYLMLIALLGWSCQKDQEQLTPVDPVPEAVVETKEQIPIEKIFYHKATEQYIYQKGDPYSFENMKRTYEQLQAKRQEQFGTRAGAGGSIELTPSHYSLKIYPRNESEQWRVERMQDVTVAYLPFDYAPLPEEEVEVMSLTRSMVEPFEEEVRYTVTYDNLQSVEGPQPPVTLNMPVLYVTWPATKPLPLDLDYEIVDQLLLPNSWTDPTPIPGFGPNYPPFPGGDSLQLFPREITLRGRVQDWDITLNEYVPIPGLMVRLTNGSSFRETFTNEAGVFTFKGTAQDLGELRIQFVLRSENWKVVRKKSTVPIIVTNGRVNAYWPSLLGEIEQHDFNLNTDMPDYEIVRGMYCFYNVNHSIPKPIYGDGLRIESVEEGGEGWNGAFYYPWDGNPAFIRIFDLIKKNNYSDSSMLGTILHEVGHFCHFCEIGDLPMQNTHSLIKESYASYTGWYLSTLFYNIFFNHELLVSESLQARQTWTKYSASVYSPLFVDLFDNYDQNSSSSSFPNDSITGFPHFAIRSIILNCADWESCRARLGEYIGIFYTQEQFDEYISNYDYWFENN